MIGHYMWCVKRQSGSVAANCYCFLNYTKPSGVLCPFLATSRSILETCRKPPSYKILCLATHIFSPARHTLMTDNDRLARHRKPRFTPFKDRGPPPESLALPTPFWQDGDRATWCKRERAFSNDLTRTIAGTASWGADGSDRTPRAGCATVDAVVDGGPQRDVSAAD